VLLSEGRQSVSLRELGPLAVVAVTIGGFYHLYSRVAELEGRLEVSEVIRSGMPVSYLDGKGLKPYRKIAINYENQPAELRVYRSSGVAPVKGHDFIMVVNREGVVIAAFSFTSETPHDQLLHRLGVDLSGREGIGN
jgi:hypothetical protein